MNDQAIEREIQDKGKTAPRVTPDDIEANIRSEVYFTAQDAARSSKAHIKSEYVEGENILAPLSLLTFCVLVLRNGFTVAGESACASPENFDAEIGRKIARQNAVSKVWPLMGYALREKLSNPIDEDQAAAMRLLAEVEPHLDEWNFPITLQDRIKQCCNKYYGDVRPLIE